MENSFFSEILTFCYNLFYSLVEFGGKILEVFSVKLSDLPLGHTGALGILIEEFLENSSIGNLSLVSFILGGGIVVYLVYQLVTWILNVVT